MIARLFFLMALLLVLPTHSWAANMFDPVAADESVKILGSMFGKLEIFNGISDGFHSAMTIFNGGVMIIGGVLMIYSLVVGTIGTAHDGEIMGKKYSSVWIPLRTVIATALVLPVINSSYCLMQFIVGWLILQGVGLADALWGAYMDGPQLIDSATMGVADNEYKKVAWDIFASAVCVNGYNKVAQELDSKGVLFDKPNFTIKSSNSPEKIVWNFGVENQAGAFKIDTCGSVIYDLNSGAAKDRVSAAIDKAEHGSNNTTALAAPNGMTRQELENKLNSANSAGAAGVAQLIQSINQVAKSFVENPTMSASSIETSIIQATRVYSDKMKAQTATLLDAAFDNKTLKENSAKEGWILAGAWYMKIVNMMDLANAIMNMGPKSSGTTGVFDSVYKDEFYKKYGAMLQVASQHSGVVMGIAENTPDSNSRDQTALGVAGSVAGNFASELWNKGWSGANFDEVIKKSFKESFGYFVIQKEDHPMMVMKAMGDFLFKTAAVLVGLFATVHYLIDDNSSYAGLKDIFNIVMMLFLPICIALGFTLNFVMPMMPFMIWLGCVLAWLVLCVEAIIAAPMWAVMHLSMSGDDMVGTGAQGYKLVLSLMLRPALMIFGFIASLSIIQVVGQFINRVFLNVYLLSQQDFGWVTMIFGLLAVPVLYLGTMWVLIIRSMNIVHQIPDQLLQWFGGGGSQLGEAAQSVGGLQSQAFAATAATAGVVKSVPNSFSQYRQMQFQRIQNEAAQRQQEEGYVNQQNTSLDRKAGAGASDIVDQHMSDKMKSGDLKGIGEGGAKGKEQREFQRAEIGAKIENNAAAISANPESSSAVSKFNKNVKNSMKNEDLTYAQAVDKHFKSAFDAENGEGAFDMAQQISKTDGMSPSQAVNNQEFRKVADIFNSTSSAVNQAGGDGAKEMGEAIKTVSKSGISSAPEKLTKVVEQMNSKIQGGDFFKSQMQTSPQNGKPPSSEE